MGRYNRSFTPNLLKKRLRQGRGQGSGYDYEPWLTVRDVPSRGLSTRIRGWKTGRVHHFLSQLELSYFLTLEWSASVIDIREQFPLFPLQQTIDIADRLGIKPPTDPKTQLPIIMTTDFLIDAVIDGKVIQRARTIKTAEDLASKRTLEKLQIERVYWNERGVDWGIVTDRDIAQQLVENIKWLHTAREFGTIPAITAEKLSLMEYYLSNFAYKPHNSLAEVGGMLDEQFNLALGSGLWVIRHLIANRRMTVDMMLPLQRRGEICFTIKPLVILEEGKLA